MRFSCFLTRVAGAATFLILATGCPQEACGHGAGGRSTNNDSIHSEGVICPRSPQFGDAPAQVQVLDGERTRSPWLLWPDFQVNENVGRCSHWDLALDVGPSGHSVAVWKDNRNGYLSLVFQRYDAQGNPLGPNIVSGESWRTDPAVAVDGSGAFVLVWQEIQIYGQMFDADGIPTGNSFLVSEGSGSLPCDYPGIGMDSSGNFVVAWEDQRNGYSDRDIYARRFDASGDPMCSSFRVNDDAGTDDQREPSVSMNATGGFAVTWLDYRGEYLSSIYAQLYDVSGNSIGSNFPTGDDTVISWQRDPSIALDSANRSVVVWLDNRNDNEDIYAQRFDSLGIPLGSNFMVNHEPTSAPQFEPFVSSEPSGNTVVVWRDQRHGNYDVYAQRYDSFGEELGGNVKVNDDSLSATHMYPCVSTDSTGNYSVLWQDERHGTADIYAQRYDSVGSTIGCNFMVNDDVGSSPQTEPSIAMNPSGGFVAAWRDCRNGNNDIYAQRYHFSGSPLGSNFLVNDDMGVQPQVYPSVGMAVSGKFVIAWMDGRDYATRIWAQRYDASGEPLGPNFQVSDDTGDASQYDPFLSMDPSGNFAVTWRDYRWYNADIFAQLYDASGSPVGENFKINDDEGNMAQSDPSVSMDSAGSFIVAWKDERNSYDSDIYAQRYNALGDPVGSNFKVNDFVPTSDQTFPSVSMDSSGGFVVAWVDHRYYPTRIRARRYDCYGNPHGGSFAVSDGMGTAFSRCSVSTEPSGGFLVTWADGRGNPYDIYAQYYASDGSPQGGNWKVNTDTKPASRGNPVVRYDGYRAVITWEDNGTPGQSYDICGNGWEFFQWNLYTELSGGSLVMRWSTAPRADFIYVFRDTFAHFEPDVAAFTNRVATLPGDSVDYVDSFGVGDPAVNASYRIMAWSTTAGELSRSNAVGEFDFSISEGTR